MKYNFDEVVNRRREDYSYSIKYPLSPAIIETLSEKIGIKTVNDDTISLWIADMDFRVAPKVQEALAGVVKHGIFGYSRPTEEYFDSVINWFKRRRGWDISMDEIVYLNGSVEALRKIVLAFTEPGDGIIVQKPVYHPFMDIIGFAKRRVVNNRLLEGEGGRYTMDFADLAEKAKDPSVKLMILCNPHNPVGRAWTKDELRELARICRENGVIIAADEIHGDLMRKGTEFNPLVKTVGPQGIVTATAVNKSFNLAGLHCTNLIFQDKELKARFVERTELPSPSPFAIAGTIAAYNECEDWLDEVREYIDGNIDWIMNFTKERMPRLKVFRPEGTYIMWLDFRGYGISPEECHEKIYNKANVFFESGTIFDPEKGQNFERVCVPSPRSVLMEAFERVAREFEG